MGHIPFSKTPLAPHNSLTEAVEVVSHHTACFRTYQKSPNIFCTVYNYNAILAVFLLHLDALLLRTYGVPTDRAVLAAVEAVQLRDVLLR